MEDKRKSILLVEDDLFLIDIYQKKLKEARFEVLVAKEGKEALKMLQEQQPDLLLLDIILPGVNGWDILKRLKQDPKFKKLKVVVFSNLAQKKEIEKGLSLGAVKYLTKAHYTPSEVVEEIKEVLSRQ